MKAVQMIGLDKSAPSCRRSLRQPLLGALTFSLALASTACGDANSPDRTPVADKWIALMKSAYKSGDFEEADRAAVQAVKVAPKDNEVRLLAAKIALTKLDYVRSLQLTEGLTTSEAHGIRGRALWYSGDIESAADELDALLQDPAVKDLWAVEISKLARRGQGRHPFSMEGGLLAAVDLPPAGVALVVPCELEGEQILALVSTAIGEVIVDSSSRREAAWVNFRFGGPAGQMEVHDVPALTQDLSGVSRQLHAPIKALLGVNLLRHAHVTFDRRGDQFIVRKSEPAAPPEASRVPLYYVRGGGMMMPIELSGGDAGRVSMMVDTTEPFAMALDDSSWKKAGVDLSSLRVAPDAPNVKEGIVPKVRIGAFDVPQIPAIEGAPVETLKSTLEIDLGGILGAGMLSLFRVTYTDDGRAAWLESDPALTNPEGMDNGGPGSGQGQGPGRSMPADSSMPRGTAPGANATIPNAAPPASAAPSSTSPGSTTKKPRVPGAAR